jgi:hypothetical protein
MLEAQSFFFLCSCIKTCDIMIVTKSCQRRWMASKTEIFKMSMKEQMEAIFHAPRSYKKSTVTTSTVTDQSPLLLQQQHVQRNEARNYKWEMDIFGK